MSVWQVFFFFFFFFYLFVCVYFKMKSAFFSDFSALLWVSGDFL